MGIWSDLTGKTGAEAARRAAGDTYDKQQSAVGRMLGYGEDFKTSTDANAKGFDPYIQNYQPYVESGQQANSALTRLMNDPSSLRALPGYQFAQEEGSRAIDRSSAARGMDASGRTLKDLTRFGTGVADQTYGNQFQRLLALSGQGLGATGAQAGVGGQQIGMQQQGLQGQLSARSTAYGGDMTSAGTIGQGEIAGANARAAGSQNIMNGALKLGGMALGAFSPSGAFGGGGGAGGGYTVIGFDSAGNPNYGRA